MAGDWIKWTKGLASRREVVILASKLGRDRHEIAGRLMVLWEWCDENIVDGDLDSVSLDASLKIGDTPFVFLDALLGLPGFAEAMNSPEVRWLTARSGGLLVFPNFGRHNGSTAKTRAYESRKKQRQRKSSPELSPNHGDKTGTREREEREKEKISIGDSNNREEQSSPSSHSPKDISRKREEPPTLPPLDLSGVDWADVYAMAEAVGKRLPPKTDDDRRAWIKYAIMAYVSFSESWLMSAADAALTAKQVKKSRVALFVEALTCSAEEKFDVKKEDFRVIFKRIRLPSDVWHSDVLRKKEGIRA